MMNSTTEKPIYGIKFCCKTLASVTSSPRYCDNISALKSWLKAPLPVSFSPSRLKGLNYETTTMFIVYISVKDTIDI